MSPFVRFILVILVAGIAINLIIVIVANGQSQSRQEQQMLDDRRLFQKVVEKYNNSLRQADIAVEWQKIDAHDQVLETSLIIRQDAQSDSEPAGAPRHHSLTRIVIPGNRLHIDGLSLEFDAFFPEEFLVLRNTKLRYFRYLYGEGPDGKPVPVEQRFSFMSPPDVPLATRIHPDIETPTFFEIRLWRTLWDLQQNDSLAKQSGLTIMEIKDAARAVAAHKAYVATLGIEGITLDEDVTPGLAESILNDAKSLDDSENP